MLETRRDSSDVVMSSEGGGRPQSFTQEAPNELKLGKGGESGESWPSACRWCRGMRRGQGTRTKDQAGPSWTSSLTSKLIENMKDIYMVTKSTNVYYTRRFAPRAAYAARYACSGRKNSVKRKKKSPCLIVSANWRLENAKRPAAMLQENNHRRHTHEYTAYVPGILCMRCTSYIYVCLEACDYTELSSLGWRIGADTVGVLD